MRLKSQLIILIYLLTYLFTAYRTRTHLLPCKVSKFPGSPVCSYLHPLRLPPARPLARLPACPRLTDPSKRNMQNSITDPPSFASSSTASTLSATRTSPPPPSAAPALPSAKSSPPVPYDNPPTSLNSPAFSSPPGPSSKAPPKTSSKGAPSLTSLTTGPASATPSRWPS